MAGGAAGRGGRLPVRAGPVRGLGGRPLVLPAAGPADRPDPAADRLLDPDVGVGRGRRGGPGARPRPAPGGPGQQRHEQPRSWSADRRYSAGSVNGNGWAGAQQPRLSKTGYGVVLTTDAATARHYDGQGSPDGSGNYSTSGPRYADTGTVTYDSTNDEYTTPDGAGGVLRFFGFQPNKPAAKQGSLKSWAGPGGDAAAVTSSDPLGRATEVQRSVVTGGSTVTESYLYAYLAGSDANAGKLSSVTLLRKTGAGAWATVRKADYTYYGSGASNGSLGHLKLATVTDAAAAVLDQWYY